MKALAKGVIKEDQGPELITWGEAVAAAVREHRPAAALQGPVRVDLLFNLPAPKKQRFEYPVTYHRNDIDKLCRTLLDHLVDARVIEDDSQVVDLVARKRYGSPGAEVWVWRVL